jgi:transcriptional regulator with XRE-family HTH domain
MMDIIDKRDRAQIFRTRLAEAMAALGQTQSALARRLGVDRSTLSALLAPGTRLPNAQLAADCAAALGVTCDWLLGLADAPQPVDALLAEALTFTPAPRALFDATIFGWHQAAAGYKVRHVPATLPDMLKTRAVVEWEYRTSLGPTAPLAIAAFEAQLYHLRSARSDYEIALPLHLLQAFAEGSGYWSGLPAPVRAGQLDQLIRLSEELYPGLRLYLFDGHNQWSAPVTVFGPNLAVLYLGHDYIAFRDPGHVARISTHFDWLVKGAPTGARDTPGVLRGLRRTLG